MTLLDSVVRSFIKLVQFFVILIFKLFFFIKYDTTKTDLKGSVNSNNRYVIAANHQHFLDPFVAISLLPFSKIRKLLPIKFITANVYYYRFYRPFAWMIGCFPAHQYKKSTKFGINESVRSLRRGYNLFIFPEGRRINNERVAARKGLAIILEQFPASELLLAHIYLDFDVYPKSLKVKFSQVGKTMHKLEPDQIMQKIYDL